MTHRHVALAVTLVALLVTAVVPASAQSAREQGSLTELLGLLQSDDATAEDLKVALARFEEVLGFQPPPCDPKNPMFNDVPASSPFCSFIEELARRGVTSGCGGGNFCPGDAVSRAQMATFIVKTLGEPAWHEVGTPGEPEFLSVFGCEWDNFDEGHTSAAFLHDGNSFVHLKGVVQVESIFSCEDSFDDPQQTGARVVFILPEGFRPARTGAFVTLTNGQLGRVTVHSGASGQPAGLVRVELPTTFDNADEWVSLDGISFRAE